MGEKPSRLITIGKLVGFTRRWNPLTTDVFARVIVDSQIINIPVDYRQQKYIEKEYPPNSNVNLTFAGGRWRIESALAVQELKTSDKFTAVF